MAVPTAAGAVRIGGPAAHVRLRVQSGTVFDFDGGIGPEGGGRIGRLSDERHRHDGEMMLCSVRQCCSTERSELWQLEARVGKVNGAGSSAA